MALQTNTIVNGAWTRQTVGMDDILRHYNGQDIQEAAVETEKIPLLGLLSQTVIRSPLAHWILPVRLRDSRSNDVAFIGDNFVLIKELRTDGHLWDVVLKDNFGARIRNAKVVGSLKVYEQGSEDPERDFFETQVKDEEEDNDVDMYHEEEPNGFHSNGTRSQLPQQALLLQLDTGDSVFLTLRHPEKGEWKFDLSRHRVSKSMIKLEAGSHLAVDPSSRYMVVGCSEGRFVIYALHSREAMRRQYSHGYTLRYVQSERHIYLQGIIQKMEFLYPAANDENHIILLVLLVWKGRTRMLLYEWQTDQDLENIRAHSRKGHALEERHRMPLMIIPLTIQSAFILVSDNTMAVVKDILLNSPKIIDFNTIIEEPTAFHHGSGPPLWTAWTRPIRRQDRANNYDDIYIVREDGLVKSLEIISEDDLIGADNNIGAFRSNCGTALASLEYSTGYDATRGDLLITGGDSCEGGTYLIKARQDPEFQQSIQNWSPAQDLVTTSVCQDQDPQNPSIHRSDKEVFPKSDKVYACAGKGLKGEIVEFRHGFEGHIGLEMEFHSPIMQAWVLPTHSTPFEPSGGSYFLLSLGNYSALLHLSGDAGSIHEIDEADALFDLRYRTLTASSYGRYRLQVTDRSIVILHGPTVNIQEGETLFQIHDQGSLNGYSHITGSGNEIESAVIHENFILYTVFNGSATILQTRNPTLSPIESSEQIAGVQNESSIRTLGIFQHRITSLAICSIKELLCAVIAEWTGSATTLIFQPFNGAPSHSTIIPRRPHGSIDDLEELVSIASSSTSEGELILVCGTRQGLVLMLQFDDNLHIKELTCDRVGATPVSIRRDELTGCKELFLVTSNVQLYGFTLREDHTSIVNGNDIMTQIRIRRTIERVWLTDVTNPRRQQPKIDSVARLPLNMSAAISNGILIVDGSQLLIAGLSTQAKAVPRHIPIGGTPSRLLYSKSLDVLIVGASVEGKSTVLFIDPETGIDISKPFDRTKKTDVQFVQGLGNHDERIFRLLEWSYMKDGKTWYFIIICTSTGMFIMLSTEKESSAGLTEREPARIRYWTRYRWKCENAIYSAIGFAEGIFYCSGKTLHCDTLDVTEKRFRPMARYELPSPAVNLVYEDGVIYALTSVHSLEVLELVHEEYRGFPSKFVRTHGDQLTRRSLHNRLIGREFHQPLQLVSDRECSVVGLWATHNTRADTLEEVFEAQLPSSILRFRYAKSRPIWDATWIRNEPNINSSEYPEILGLSIDGSLHHFTVLDIAAWSLLRFIVNLALQSTLLCELTFEERDVFKVQPRTQPKIMMHVDGDILKRCLENRSLGDLLVWETEEDRSKVEDTFRDLMVAIHRGDIDRNMPLELLEDQAYEDLRFFLRPVL